MSYPTQEDELRAKEAVAENDMRSAEPGFLETFQAVPKANAGRLAEISRMALADFNSVMEYARSEPYEKQENMMAGMKKLLEEEINVIEARREYVTRINPATGSESLR